LVLRAWCCSINTKVERLKAKNILTSQSVMIAIIDNLSPEYVSSYLSVCAVQSKP